ncbi:efflux RND transporter periplasmic adaptor subunit [Achromobacter aloeverae]|uniref:Efflux transporter periplasmic adaptor subunit n=1 Tax=Achromobacter aloeverae TaxID=1750518 RepID=A0A4V1MSG1_9BURK|nr:efflux RND transporter periplasmic adaptor subunit [Achromobacter aloeverae]RXN91459.1 efflux transporter periplasmic adaptor subunit [Achromobacter aloeverae]
MSEERHHALGIHSLSGEPGGADLPTRDRIVRRLRWLTLAVLVLLALGAARTIIARVQNASDLREGTAQRAIQYVQTAMPAAPDKGQTLSLPGTLQGYVQSPLSARASGYLKLWTKDIGSRVEKGDLLAEIETPEIDQQLSQAVAAREQAAAAMDLARSTQSRWEALRQKDVVSQQDLDEKRGAAAQARANYAAAQANEQRLRQLEGFKRIVAPFAGVITRRNVDVGDLIDAGSGRPLFVLSQTDPLRVYLNVPQSYAQRVKPGQHVVVTQAELPGQAFKGVIARTAASIDLATRTMQVEISLPNPDKMLLPGAYVQVDLHLPPGDTLVLPANALMFRREGALVAVVDDAGKVSLRKVTLGRNYGQTVEVPQGVTATDRVVLNPADSLANGDQVAVADNAGGKAAQGTDTAATAGGQSANREAAKAPAQGRDK